MISAKAPNKDDLKRVYVATSKTVGDHVFLNLAWVRIPQNTTSPSAHVAFEFNQSETLCGGSSDGLVQRSTARRRHADRLRLRGRRHRHPDDQAVALDRHRGLRGQHQHPAVLGRRPDAGRPASPRPGSTPRPSDRSRTPSNRRPRRTRSGSTSSVRRGSTSPTPASSRRANAARSATRTRSAALPAPRPRRR